MLCPNCAQMVAEGSRFCMYCGFHLTLEGWAEKTMAERVATTVCEYLEDFSEKTKVISKETLQQKPKKKVKTPKPLFFAWLVSLEGPDKDKDYRITKEKISIGKSEDSDILIKSEFVSRNHAALFYENHRYVLNDLQSTNRTYVNDKKISRRILKDNDVIKFGETVYKFKCLHFHKVLWYC